MVEPPDDVDLYLNSDREFEVGQDGDLRTVTGFDNVEQSLGIFAGNAVRDLIGQPIDGATLSKVESRLQDELERERYLDDIQRVDVTEINETTGTVSVDVFVSYDESLTFEVSQ